MDYAPMAALLDLARGVALAAVRRLIQLSLDAKSKSGENWSGEVMGYVASSDLAGTGH
jgi:hypothetical protein